MNFAGNKFTYLSKNKISTVEKIKSEHNTNSKNLDIIIEKEENLPHSMMSNDLKSSDPIQIPSRRSRAKDLNRSKSRSRSKSKESVYDEELDEVYSDTELDEHPKLSSNINNNLNVARKMENNIQEESSNINNNSKKKSGGFFAKISSFFSRSSKKNEDKKLSSNNNNNNNNNIKLSSKEENFRHKKYEHDVDTNILSFNFGFLGQKVEYATGDPYECANCKAILNHFSSITPIEGSFKSLWTCEFCNFCNEITIQKEEIPKTESIDYFVQSFNQIDGKLKDLNFNDEQHIIICFDISGSMCVCEPIQGKHMIKGKDKLDKLASDLMQFSDGSDQHYGRTKNMTYVSRLQCLQAAIENNIQTLLKNTPRRKLGIVAFNNEVIAIGDGTKEKVVINGNNLNEYDFIRKRAEETSGIISTEISQSHEALVKQLYSLEETGQTALGPAILYAISLIQGVSPGSKIILCTDGMANLGLGAMDNLKTEEEISAAKVFYETLGNIAVSKGVMVNLITFAGEESKISILSTLCEQTGGDIIRVKPTEILEQFSNVLSNEIIATNVEIKVKLHKALTFRNEDKSALRDNNSTLVKEIGNATEQMELFVEYAFKKSEDLIKENIDLVSLKAVPFQSIISYITKNGDRCIRVLTSEQIICSDKSEIEKQAKMELVSVNAIKQTTKLASQGLYREAQSNAKAWKKMIKKSANNNNDAFDCYNNLNRNLCEINNDLQMEQIQEIEDNDMDCMFESSTTRKQASRMNKRKDDLSEKLHVMKSKLNTRNFKK